MDGQTKRGTDSLIARYIDRMTSDGKLDRIMGRQINEHRNTEEQIDESRDTDGWTDRRTDGHRRIDV